MWISDFSLPDVNVKKDFEFDSFYLLGKPKVLGTKVVSFIEELNYIDLLNNSDIAGVICTEKIATELENRFRGGYCVSEYPKRTFFTLYNGLARKSKKIMETTISDSAQIHKTAVIAKQNVTIGANVKVGANTIIREGTYIGDHVSIDENCVLGAPGFYHVFDSCGRVTVESTGSLKIDENAVIHSNVIIEKGAIGGETYLGKNIAIGNSVLIEHNNYIEDNCRIAGNCAFAGGVFIGEGADIGLSVSVAPNIHIGRNARLSIGAVVTKDVPDSCRYSGNFAIEHPQFIDHIKMISKK